MSTTRNRLPLSLPNVLLIGISLIGAGITLVLQNWVGAALLLALGVGGLISAVVARREGASDWLRVNAIEYRDERDSRLAAHGFAVVGAWALALAAVELVAATIFTGAVGVITTTPGMDGGVTYTLQGVGAVGLGLELLAALQLLALSLVWGIANTRAVKRG